MCIIHFRLMHAQCYLCISTLSLWYIDCRYQQISHVHVVVHKITTLSTIYNMKTGHVVLSVIQYVTSLDSVTLHCMILHCTVYTRMAISGNRTHFCSITWYYSNPRDTRHVVIVTHVTHRVMHHVIHQFHATTQMFNLYPTCSILYLTLADVYNAMFLHLSLVKTRCDVRICVKCLPLFYKRE